MLHLPKAHGSARCQTTYCARSLAHRGRTERWPECRPVESVRRSALKFVTAAADLRPSFVTSSEYQSSTPEGAADCLVEILQAIWLGEKLHFPVLRRRFGKSGGEEDLDAGPELLRLVRQIQPGHPTRHDNIGEQQVYRLVAL